MIIDREVEMDASTKFILAKAGAANDTETAMHNASILWCVAVVIEDDVLRNRVSLLIADWKKSIALGKCNAL